MPITRSINFPIVIEVSGPEDKSGLDDVQFAQALYESILPDFKIFAEAVKVRATYIMAGEDVNEALKPKLN